jgi:hypothetical protein
MWGYAGLLEGDGDRAGGTGDGVGQAADDGLAGDGAVFVVVAEVGVEVTGQLVLGVVREQSQHHLKAAAAGAQQSDFGLGSMTWRGLGLGRSSRCPASCVRW